jgi:hypothetical protein
MYMLHRATKYEDAKNKVSAELVRTLVALYTIYSVNRNMEYMINIEVNNNLF